MTNHKRLAMGNFLGLLSDISDELEFLSNTVQIFRGLKCGFPVPNFGYVGPQHRPLNKKVQWPAIDDAEARSVSWCALERTLLFINFLLCALKFQHIRVNNCKSTYSASLIWLEI